jgi:cysteinyl-tRNA synthetase
VASALRDAPERVLSALDNDLNTSVALSVIGEVARMGNDIVQDLGRKRKDPAAMAAGVALAALAVESLDACCKPLGLMQTSGGDFATRTRERRLKVRRLDAASIEKKVKERTEARAAKDFARGDAIRAELLALGVELQDVPGGGGTTWRVKI